MSEGQRQQQGQSQQQQQGQQAGKSRPAPKSLFDSTNIIAACLWLSVALPFALALTNALTSVPTACRDLNGLIIPSCTAQLISGGLVPVVFAIGVFAKLCVSVGSRRIRNFWWNFTFDVADIMLNLFTLYWLLCLQLGFVPGLRAIVQTAVANIDVPTITGALVLLGLAFLAKRGPDLFLDSPPPGAPRK